MRKSWSFILTLLLILTGAMFFSASASEAKIEKLDKKWKEGQPIGLLKQWERSKHAEKGVSCNACHGEDPNNIKKPSAGTCATCHSKVYEDFSKSTHSTALVHAMSKDSHVYHGKTVEYKWQAYPEGGPKDWGCANCHSVGYVAEDQSKGNCATCHSGHEFSLKQARHPDACSKCHTGPGHPQNEAYATSKHGILWAAHGNEYDLGGSTKEFWARQETDPLGTPVCVTCHMPQGTHNTRGGMAHDLYGSRNPDYEKQVTFMVENSCKNCHSEEKAYEWLGNADRIASFTLERLGEARKSIGNLRRDGLIRPTMDVTNSHPIAGQLSYAESSFFQIVMATNRARKGAYHMSALWAGRLGWTDQSFALMAFRSEVERLRSDAERDKKLKELEDRLKTSKK
ncbi:multiheme c-type cytochrome [Desulfurivibrio sp. C05AmB]|uniref:multiheme c-type cytochrome n=1 Tax=Desulfurivibrio sp. C05AmB TaxID=3374371 RepID=UPI00376EC142